MPEQAPNPQQEQFVQAFNDARQAALEAGPEHFHAAGGRTGGVMIGHESAYAPSISASKDRDHYKTGASKQPGETHHDYTGVITENYDGEDLARQEVTRLNQQTGEYYRHTFKDPNTARKFGALIAKHVQNRAEVDIKSRNKAA